MEHGMIGQGSHVTIKATGEDGVVVAPSSGGPYKLYHAGAGQWNIPVFSVLLDSGEMRQYTQAAINLVE